jgi:hypothetical protein
VLDGHPCQGTKGGSITFSPDGSHDVYAVNGTAMGGWAAQEGWKNEPFDADEMLAFDGEPVTFGTSGYWTL